MFHKYAGSKWHNYEAECVQEVLDMYDGDEMKARKAVIASFDKLVKRDKLQQEKRTLWGKIKALFIKPEVIELTEFDMSVDAVNFATQGRWYMDGLQTLGVASAGPIKD